MVYLILPVVLSAVALFIASFLSWMVLQLHKDDWRKLTNEDGVMAATRDVPVGSYMFPRANNMAEMKTEEFLKKYDAGPRGTLTILPKTNMGMNLALTFGYFLLVSALLAALLFMGDPNRMGDFGFVFRFVFTAGLMTFLAAMVQHAIWFRPRIVGHVIESIAYAAIVGLIFAALWPSA